MKKSITSICIVLSLLLGLSVPVFAASEPVAESQIIEQSTYTLPTNDPNHTTTISETTYDNGIIEVATTVVDRVPDPARAVSGTVSAHHSLDVIIKNNIKVATFTIDATFKYDDGAGTVSVISMSKGNPYLRSGWNLSGHSLFSESGAAVLWVKAWVNVKSGYNLVNKDVPYSNPSGYLEILCRTDGSIITA